MNMKPILNDMISVNDFRNFYWYKEELIDFCRLYHLDQRGGKMELEKRIEVFLKAGEREVYQKKSASSKFDWNNKE